MRWHADMHVVGNFSKGIIQLIKLCKFSTNVLPEYVSKELNIKAYAFE